MTALLYQTGNQVAALDATPVIVPTSGEFGAGFLRTVDDWVAVAAAGHSQFSTMRMLRFPTGAKVKSLQLFTDTPPDSNATQQLAFYIDVAFSDSTVDGTPAVYQAQIPTTVGVGAGNPSGTTAVAATVTAPKPGAYTTPNNLFGTLTMAGNNKPLATGNLLFTQFNTGLTTSTAGVGQGGYSAAQISNVPLWQVFGFVNGLGLPQDPGGFFDILLTVKTVAATAAAYTMYGKLEYVL